MQNASKGVTRRFGVKSIISVLAVALVFALQAGCQKKSSGDYGLSLKETLRINIGTEPPSLDLHISTDTTSSIIHDNLMEGLVMYDLTAPEVSLKAALAEKWESTDSKIWNIQLRKGVKWSDGVDFTAQQVVDGWERLLNSATASEYAYFLFGVKNAKAYNQGKIKNFKDVGVSVTPEGNLRVELENPRAYFPFLLTHHSTWPMRKDLLAKFGDKWTLPGNNVGLGPYVLKTWEHDKAIVLERNEKYYGAPAKTKYIIGYMVNEQSTAINLFDAGKIDVQLSLPSRELESLRKRPEYRSSSTLSTYYYGFNTTKPPMNNPVVRQAIAAAIDKKEVVKILKGGQVPLGGWLPPGMFGYSEQGGIEFNPARAKELLVKAGYKEAKDFPKMSIDFNQNEDHQRIAENIQAQLKRNLGIEVELNSEEWKVYLKRLNVDPPPVFRLGWVADYPDPDNFFTLMASYSENNRTKWKNKEFDSLIEKAAFLMDKEQRKELYKKAQKILVEDEVPVIPMFSSVSSKLVAKRVENFPVTVMDRIYLKDVSLKE